MKTENVHVLNGDALKAIFPKSLEGEKVVVRECLIEGDVSENCLDMFFEQKASFICSTYNVVLEEYDAMTLKEFEHLKDFSFNSHFYLWFEKDLFCQTNFWFTLFYLTHYQDELKCSLVLPKEGHEYSFATMSEEELEEAFTYAIVLTQDEIKIISALWKAYMQGAANRMKLEALKLERFPFIQTAVELNIQKEFVKESLEEIKRRLNTDDFVTIFRTFTQEQPAFGYGDLQVKRLLQ